MKKRILIIVCWLNRNLRYGNSKNRLFQYLIIRSRVFLKEVIAKNSEEVDSIGLIKIKLKYAGTMQLATTDFVDRWLFTGADFEPSVVRLLRKVLSEGDNVLDIGANIGYFSLIASNIIGPHGIVYAFEPTPETVDRFQKNIELNKRKNIRVIKKAVSNNVGITTFNVPIGDLKNSGRSSLRDMEDNCMRINVETITVDSLLNTLEKINVIKMDIEGAEGLALDGMKDLFKRDQPVIIMELSDRFLRQTGYSSQSVLDFFITREYRIYIADDRGMEVKDYAGLVGDQYNIICLPPGRFITD